PLLSRPIRVAVEWDSSVVAEVVRGKPGTVSVGEGANADLTVPGVPGRVALVRVTKDGAALLAIPSGWAGTVVVDGRPRSVSEVGADARLGPNDTARLLPSAESRTVVVVEAAEAAILPRAGRRDWALVEALVLALVLHSTFLVSSYLFARPTTDEGPKKLEMRQARFILKKPEPEKTVEALPEEALRAKQVSKEKLAPGAKTEKQKIEQKVKKIGVLGALGAASVLFSSESDRALDNALHGLAGNSIQVAGGAGTRGGGTGMGGGGTGGFGGTSYGGGVIGGVGEAAGVRANLGKRGEAKARVNIEAGRSNVEGSLTQAQIEAVVRAHLAGIKYCYEKELVGAPKLEGTVTIKWWIDGEGEVFKALVDSSTANNPGLEECVVRQINRWRFPKPGGGTVIVRYPFSFKSAS
ncbi:MAG: AgmX/PglI C-terminal domain-containing protein, partial [Myxococcota bacterium]